MRVESGIILGFIMAMVCYLVIMLTTLRLRQLSNAIILDGVDSDSNLQLFLVDYTTFEWEILDDMYVARIPIKSLKYTVELVRGNMVKLKITDSIYTITNHIEYKFISEEMVTFFKELPERLKYEEKHNDPN